MLASKFLLLFLLVHSIKAQCSPNLKLEGVETGTVSAALGSSNLQLNPSNPQTDYMYPFKNTLLTAPQVAFALNSFDGTRVTGFAFQILSADTSGSSVKIRLVTPWEITSWTSLKFTVLINSRVDFEVGSFSPQNWQPTDRQVTIPFLKRYNVSAQIVARPYLSGIFIQTALPSFSLQMMQIETRESSFVVGVASNAPVNGIYVSYFVFSPPNSGFVSYGGIASQPYINGAIHQTIQMSLSYSDNSLFGITGFSFTNSSRFSLGSSIDSRFILSTTGNSYNTTVSFIAVGNNPNTVCSGCPGTVPSYDRCVTGCSNGQALFSYSGQNSRGCIDCPSYAFLKVNPTNTDCMCQQGYYVVRGACTPVQNAAQSSFVQANMTAEALQTQFFNSLSAGSVTSQTTQTQTQTQNLVCPDPNSYLSNNNCYCLPGFYLINGNCNKCPDGSYYNGSLCLAVSQPGQNTQPAQTQPVSQPQNPQTANSLPSALPIFTPQPNNPNTNIILNPGPDQISVVVPGQTDNIQVINVPSGTDPSIFFPPGLVPDNIIVIVNETSSQNWWNNDGNFNWNGYFNPQLRICPINQYLASPRTCVCIPGYIRNQNGICIPNNNNFPCTMRYAFINGNGYCVCPTGMSFNMNYECVPIGPTVDCPVGGFLQSDGTCICLSPFINSGGVCIICRSGFFWNGLACVLSCPIDRIFNPATVSCVCENGFVEGAFQNCVRCPVNSVPLNNFCVYCPPYSVRQGERCVCVPGSQPQNSICVPICPPRSYFDQTLQRCICYDQNNYLNPMGVCASCPIGRFYNGETCIECPLPSWFDFRLKICRICNPPFFHYSGQCVVCPDNALWNPLVRRCECILGYSVINGICQVNPNCPNGKIVNGLCVMCRNGEVIGTTCVCLPGFQQVAPGVCLPICVLPERRNRNGVCVACPLNSIWDSNLLDCVCNSAAGFIWNPTLGVCVGNCPPIISVPQGGQCVCVDGYYSVPAPLYCVSCIQNCLRCTSIVCQVCRPGFVLSGNVCVPSCGAGFFLLNNVCNPCISPCLTCSVSGTNCNSCVAGFNLIGNTCQRSCQTNAVWSPALNACVCIDGFFNFQNTCLRCLPVCVTCTTLVNCVRCQNGQPPVAGICNPNTCLGGAILTNGVCVCPPRFFYSGTGCVECIQFCLTCTSINTCTTCVEPRIFNAGANQCQCPTGMTTNPLTQQCICPARTYWDTTLRRCNECPVNCLTCTSSTTCTICVNPLIQPVNGQCNINPVCVAPQYACLRGCCTCSVPLCTRCNYNLESICDECTPPAIRTILGQCSNGGGGCNPACAQGEICFRNRCYSWNNNLFRMSLISDIVSGVDVSNFRISILPAITYFQTQFGALAALNSRTFVEISFQGLTVRQIPSAYCQQDTTNLANWNCIVPYYNQPIPIPYNLILTATSPTNPLLSAILVITINPVQARSSITDATAIMRTPGSLVTITTMGNVVSAGVIRP